MALASSLLPAPSLPSLLLALIAVPLAYFVLRSLYRISLFYPLARIPGPLLPRLSSLWLTSHAWLGDEATIVHHLHEIYGSIVRTGPNSVDISDGAALSDIYASKGGFRKPAFYGNFDIDGHKSIFSEIVPETRAPRAKAVLPLFATAGLRSGKDVIHNIVDKFVQRVQAASQSKRKPVNLLNFTRGLALDVVTGYLFGKAYGGLDFDSSSSAPKEQAAITAELKSEQHGDVKEMSANGMVDVFVAVGRFWYLPSWTFQWVEWLDSKFGEGSTPHVGHSLGLVDSYVAGVVTDALAANSTGKPTNGVATTSYPARLLAAGISPSETRAQCKDLIFAGTDSTGMNLATIIWHLAKQPETWANLKQECTATTTTDLIEIQNLPYLRGVVREGLRLSMANPSRLPRLVPPGGWTFDGAYFPPGTVISCTPFELHLNPLVFPDPRTFKPERWTEAQTAMERDFIPFGLGSRQCIARNLAVAELFVAVKLLAETGCLDGAGAVGEGIRIQEWFNSHVVGGRIEVIWE